MKKVCFIISGFLMGFYALNCAARTALEDFPVKFPQQLRTKEDFKAISQLRGDRKLTADEQEKRDLLVELLLDLYFPRI